MVLWTVSYLWVNQTVPLRDSGGKRCEKGFDYPLLPVGLVWLLGHIFFCLGILLLAQDTPLALPDSFLGGIATSIAFSGLFLRPALRWVGRVPSREGETA